ncbi:MAG: GTPase, partial [Streptosporangiaceae bacterium]
RAGERLRLSSEHTVVALAGGTGSGKSSLFNALAGADFSTVGVTRPVTRQTHACVWGIRGSGPLLEWLGVPRPNRYARSSALDRGERSLAGLVLLDLPDHDTVMTHASGLVDGLVQMADLMIWVLDPQKYADAAVHRRFLVPLAGHSDVLSVVLNQSDLLTAAQTEDCVGDLRRLLDAEQLPEVQILVTSAVSGAGLDDLRRLLAEAVSARRAAADRISADVDAMAERFAPYAGDAAQPAVVAPAGVEAVVDAFAAAAGVPAVGDTLRSARELRAVDYVGWPAAWLAERLAGRNPIRKARLGQLWEEVRSVTAGPAGAQQAEVDNALTRLADEASEPLPEPWSQTVRSAVRSRAPEIPAALGAGMGRALPAENKVAGWWRLAGSWQGLLLGSAIVGLAWLAALVVLGGFHADRSAPRLFTDLVLVPVVALAIVVVLLLGWLSARASLNAVRAAADQEAAEFTRAMRGQIAAVVQEMAVAPAEAELAELTRYRHQLAVAASRTA